MSHQWVYRFGPKTDGNATLKNLLGGKGANLAEMASLDLPVPPGFTITTEVCTAYYQNDETYPKELTSQVEKALVDIEKTLQMKFGDAENPLLLSVRSGARVSMPGMMDTVLNLGLNSKTVKGLAERSGDPRFAWDSYRRFIQMYANVVLDMSHHDFESILDEFKRDNDIENDTEISAAQWQVIVEDYQDLVKRELGKPFPEDPHEQLWTAISAVFKSWQTPRAVTYRRLNTIPEEWGTAVNVQAMVFGNMGEDCATGVAFTRDPSTGENYFYGEYLVNAQGEDVVAGIRTPQSLTIAGREKEGSDLPSMEEIMPDVFHQLVDVREKLEKHYKDMQDIEFTVQQGKLYMLQTRTGKRTAAAALKIAVDMVEEDLITQEDALLRIDANSLDQLLHPTLDPNAERFVIGKGLPASPGAASGQLVFSADEAEHLANNGEAVILARTETSPEDIHGMHAAKGILTTRGGMTSHAAVVARGMGRACVAGAGTLQIDYASQTLTAGSETFNKGDVVTIDGSTGEIMKGAVKTLKPELSGDFATIMKWADSTRRMRVRANAETETDAKTALEFGAQGIGLCRTEHMFFDPERIQKVREMIFAENLEARTKALNALLPEQRKDFKALFSVMNGFPVTVRLLDPPLHEFLPHEDKDITQFAASAGILESKVRKRLSELHESNPMLGHRGCRLGVTYPEIYAMQARAIIEGAIEAAEDGAAAVIPEIMIPLVSVAPELKSLKKVVDDTARDIINETGQVIEYIVGTMIELPRAALTADELAKEALFFSFGTNDLTQTTLGLSRDDAGAFLPFYVEKSLMPEDPFVSIDVDGVGQLVRIACEKGRQTREDIKLGICGEHGGDPASINFCEEVGLDYVSCSPFRVPIARLAAAQASVRQAKGAKKDRKKAA
ncbi:MAG: pyruvate, phosphate dikinase [Micavibrio sp.]|nr:pyruvate, phosphate dikinase [Micavibrio sp.]|tara:strand:+ start:102947 stop:105643 length:2697 start_codon:yes stop_codon:yes gene_type:complete